jgi:N-acetylneuraminic acid mutarotase
MKVRMILCVILMAALAACGAPAATEVAVAPTATLIPATDTPVPPAATATEPPADTVPSEPPTPMPLPAGWVRRGDMPEPARLGFGAAVVENQIYVMGGQVGDDGMTTVDVYDPVTDLWTQRASMLYKTVYPGISVVDGRIYVMGGYTDVTSASSNALVEEYNPATDTWTEKASMPAPREGLVTAVAGDKIYAIGGAYLTADSPTPEVLAAVAEYDPATDTWTEKAPLPTVRTWAMGGVVDDKIYVIGGATQPISRILSSLVEYDPAIDAWTEKSPMPAPRFGGAAVVHDGLIYVSGGAVQPGGS